MSKDENIKPKRTRRTKAEIEADRLKEESEKKSGNNVKKETNAKKETKVKEEVKKEVKKTTDKKEVEKATTKKAPAKKAPARKSTKEKSKKIEEIMNVVDNIIVESLSDVMGDRFGRYSKYIIQDRALPDVRDGLKPVQRRILFSMYEEGNRHNKSYRKCAKGVGAVMGNYHPHGDSSIYDAMVRMSQDWKLRNMLIDIHGNNGSMDGDGAAAMRYTEARLSEFAEELLADIDKETVDMAYNFDDSAKEPVVLPASYPNLLVNGSTGISAGYATNIPTHNLRETIEAAIMVLDKKNVKLSDLMKVIKGPDFPTGGIIQGLDGIKQAYETGKGRIVIRSKIDVESLKGGKEQIIITEIPYEVNKQNLVKKIDEIRAEKKVDGIVEVRDESSREGVRVVIELRKEVNSELILNYLLKNTDLQVNYNFNMVCIVDRTPKLVGLIEILEAFNNHRKEVVTRRLNYELLKSEKRLHIVEGLIKALSILDKVVATIKSSKNKADAKVNIESKYGFSSEQSEAIVSLQLYRLSNTDINELEKEKSSLEKEIKKIIGILESEVKLKNLIKKEYEDIAANYGDNRRSTIQAEVEEIKVDETQLIVEEDVFISVSKDGYIKRSSNRSVSSSGGKEECGIKEGDELILLEEAKNTQVLLVFTDKGNYAYLPVHQLKEDRWKDVGTHLSSHVSAGGGESILRAIILDNLDDEMYVSVLKQNGLIKRTLIKEYEVTRNSKLYSGVKMAKDDVVLGTWITDSSNTVLVYSKLGYGLKFSEDEVNPKGIKTDGMRAIDLREGDIVEKAFMVSEKEVAKIEKEHGVLATYPRGRKGNKIKKGK